MNRSKLYAYRSSCVRAARQACRKALDAPFYQAYEGPDYAIHPTKPHGNWWDDDEYFYELRGPALEASQNASSSDMSINKA